MDKELILYSNDEFFDYVVHYICSEENISKKINKFKYLSESTLKPFEYRRRSDKELKIKICEAEDTSFQFDYKEKVIHFHLETLTKNNGIQTIMVPSGVGCGGVEAALEVSLGAPTSTPKDSSEDFWVTVEGAT